MDAKELELLVREIPIEMVDAACRGAYNRRPNSDLKTKPNARIEYVFGYICSDGHIPIDDLAISFSEPSLVKARICECGKLARFQVLRRVTQPVWAPVLSLPHFEFINGRYALSYPWAWQFSRELSCVTFEFDRRVQTRVLLTLRCLVSLRFIPWLRSKLLTTCRLSI